MKKLSIEEKAKAYDNVREKIATRFGSNVADEIFSEYEESEGERIRKELIEHIVRNVGLHPGENRKEHEWLAWLEKLGEKTKPIEGFNTEFEKQVSCLIASVINKDYEYTKDFVKWVSDALLNYAKHEIEKQGEHKPTIEMITPEESLGIDSDTYNKIVDECIYGKQNHADKVKPKFKVGDIIYKPSNSSCPVHSSIDDTLCTVIKVLDNHYVLDTNEGKIQEPFAWQDYYELVEQKPAWSEEDEETLNTIINHFKIDIECTDEDDIVRWLNRLKERYTWKPSDEQIEALWNVYQGGKEQAELATLYNDLKKLRGK